MMAILRREQSTKSTTRHETGNLVIVAYSFGVLTLPGISLESMPLLAVPPYANKDANLQQRIVNLAVSVLGCCHIGTTVSCPSTCSWWKLVGLSSLLCKRQPVSVATNEDAMRGGVWMSSQRWLTESTFGWCLPQRLAARCRDAYLNVHDWNPGEPAQKA